MKIFMGFNYQKLFIIHDYKKIVENKIYLLQLISSEPSSQSGSKSHFQYNGMHFPLLHWKEFGPQETLVHFV